jgi:hypothetical protein
MFIEGGHLLFLGNELLRALYKHRAPNGAKLANADYDLSFGATAWPYVRIVPPKPTAQPWF